MNNQGHDVKAIKRLTLHCYQIGLVIELPSYY